MAGLFAHPEWLAPLAAGGGALWLAIAWASARSRRRMRALVGPALARSQPLAPLRDVVPLAAVALLATALLGPRLAQSTLQLSTSGIDLALLIDTSRSMDARDIPPSRIDSARRAAVGILDRLGPGDRAALAIFAGRGVLLTPLTPDHAALRDMLAELDTSLVKTGGSELASGIASALNAFEPGANRSRAIFILSDGEAFDFPAAESSVRASRANTRIFAAAIGSEAGAPIPDHGAPLRDSAGEVVRTRRRTGPLEQLTQRTGGELFVADEWGHFNLERAVRALHAPLDGAPGEFVEQPVTAPVVLPFAALAALLLWLEWLPIARRRPRDFPHVSTRRSPGRWHRVRRHPGACGRGRRRLATTLLAGLCFFLLAAGGPLHDPEWQSTASAATWLQRGLERARQADWSDAERAFLASAVLSSDAKTSALAYYNLGVAALNGRDLETARTAFFDSLSATDSATDRSLDATLLAQTQFNLEWTLLRLEQQAAPGAPQASESAARGPAPPAKAPAQARAPDLDGEGRRRWLEGVEDRPRRALLSAGLEQLERNPAPQSRGPSW